MAGNAALESLAQATAGAGGGIFATVVLQPLEVVKTRISVSQHGGASIQETFREIIASEGFSALYSGLSAKCSETCLKNFVYFYVYDAIMRVAKQHRKITTALNLALGYVAGVVTTSSTMPLEVLSTRLQAEKGGGDGMVSLARRIIATEGIGGLFKAYWWNMLLCINPAIQNTVFDKMKANIIKVKAGGDVKLRVFLSPFEAFLLGALSKALATVITYPMVRAKTIMQAGSSAGKQDGSDVELSPLQRLSELYRGLASALVKGVLQAALLYMMKDQIARFVVVTFKQASRLLGANGRRHKLKALAGRSLAS
mmetsp:Transcript_81194/g.146553  ORF Transcript_81194/g.146553 Transcript_81194/m.146553 type:complete len:312 (+) Transcript_81194:79-1014(+)